LVTVLWCAVLAGPAGAAAQNYQVERLCGGPIVTAEHFRAVGAPESEGANLNGPTMVRLPGWLEPSRRADPAARYYLYFAHHKGDYIRLAWAAEPCGPWRLFRTGPDVAAGAHGVLDLGAADELEIGNGLEIFDHVASPEIVVDDDNHRFVMYFHGRVRYQGKAFVRQHTFVAVSADGLDFNGAIEPVMLGNSYFRVFNVRDSLYAISNSATLYRAPAAADPWTPPAGFDFSTELWTQRADALIPMETNPLGGPILPRHSWVHPMGDRLEVFLTRVGDVPERIVVVEVDARDPDFRSWRQVAPAHELLRAELPWEGSGITPEPSSYDWAPEPVNQLRDPYVFEQDGELYLLYSGAGEQAIGIAKLSRIPSSSR